MSSPDMVGGVGYKWWEGNAQELHVIDTVHLNLYFKVFASVLSREVKLYRGGV